MRTYCWLIVTAATVTAVGCGTNATSPQAPTITPDKPLGADDRVENPAYTRWAKAAPGTVVVYDETTDVGGTVTRGRRAHTLVAVSESMAEVESQDLNPETGEPIGTPQTLKHMRWMVKPKGKEDAADPGRPAGTYATGNEEVTVHGKTYQTKWYKAKGHVEAGETDTQTWYATEVPGGLVKSVHAIPNAKKSVTTELAEIRTP